jgi:hypothetical protein
VRISDDDAFEDRSLFYVDAYSCESADDIPSQDGWMSMSMEERRASNAAFEKISVPYHREIARDDPDLVAVVRELGDAAGGKCAKLEIVEIPDGVKWQIEEYDGSEHVAEAHRTWP